MRLNISFLFAFALTSGTALGQSDYPLNQQFKTDSIQQIQDIVVTGTNMATENNKLPYSISIVSNKEIEESGQSKLLNVLSGRVPSLFVTERGIGGFGISTGGSGAIKIRGVGGSPTSQVLMMVDGQPQFAGIYSHHVADAYTTDYVEKVEVIRGPASVLYGSNAMGGAINIITKHARQEGVRTTLNAQYGSYNTSKFDLTNMTRFGKFSSLVALNYDRTDGYKKDFDFKQGGGYVKLGYDFTENWNATMDYNLTKFTGSDPSYVSEENPDPYKQNIIRGATSLNVNNNYGNTSGSVKLFYSYGNHFIYDPRPFHSLDDHFGIIAYQSFSLFKDNAFTVGLDYTHYTGEIKMSGGTAHTEGSVSTIGKKKVDETAPYILASQGLFNDWINLNAGLRFVINEKFGNSWIPQGGITLFPKGNSIVKGSVAKGYRNPSFRELYLYRPANPELRPESMMNYEVSFTQYLLQRTLQLELTGYISRGKDLIQTVARPDLGHPLNENTGKFKNKGIEFSALYHILSNLNVNATYSYMHTDLKNLTGAPKNQLFFGIDYQPIRQLRFDVQVKHIGGLFVAEDVKHQNYTLLDTKITYYPATGIELYVLIDNILDQKYMINYNYPMPGCMAFGGVKVRF